MNLKSMIRLSLLPLLLAGGLSAPCFAAAKTPTAGTIRSHSVGSLRLVTADFSDLDDGDTWASGISGILAVWVSDTDDPTTQASVGIAAAFSGSTVTVYPAEDNKTGTVYVLTR